MSMETACISLKLANECKNIDIEIFKIIIDDLKKINSEEEIDFLNKVILDLSLQILDKGLSLDENIKKYYLENQ